jgi:hypothetical protein
MMYVLIGFSFGVSLTLAAILAYLWATGDLVEDEADQWWLP